MTAFASKQIRVTSEILVILSWFYLLYVLPGPMAKIHYSTPNSSPKKNAFYFFHLRVRQGPRNQQFQKHVASPGCRMTTPSSNLQHQIHIEVLEPGSVMANEHDIRTPKSWAFFLLMCFKLLPQYVDFFVPVDKIVTGY